MRNLLQLGQTIKTNFFNIKYLREDFNFLIKLHLNFIFTGKLKHAINSEGVRQQLQQMQHNLPPGGIQLPESVGNVMSQSNENQAPQQILDTSQPPPIRPPTSAPLLPPPPPNPQLQMMPPGFPMSNVPRKFLNIKKKYANIFYLFEKM